MTVFFKYFTKSNNSQFSFQHIGLGILFFALTNQVTAQTDGSGPSGWCGYYGVNTGTHTSLGMKPTTGTKWDTSFISVPCMGASIASSCPSGYNRLQFGTFSWAIDSAADTSFTCVKKAEIPSKLADSMNVEGMFCGASILNSGNRSSISLDSSSSNADVTCQGKRPYLDGCPTGYTPTYWAAVSYSDDSSADYIYTCMRNTKQAAKTDDRRGAYCGFSMNNYGNRYAIASQGTYSTSASVQCLGNDIVTQGCPANYKKLSFSVRSWSDDSSADTISTCINTLSSQCDTSGSGSSNVQCAIDGAWSALSVEAGVDNFLYDVKYCNSPVPQGTGKTCQVESGFTLAATSPIAKEIKKQNVCASGYLLKNSQCQVDLSGKMGLVNIFEESALRTSYVTANTGAQTIYYKLVTLKSGDLVRLRGQAELTNDTTTPISGTVYLTVGGQQLSQSFSENVIVDQVHHLPFWADAVYQAPYDGNFYFELKVIASRSDSSPSVLVESGYGHLVIEHYRPLSESNISTTKGVAGIVNSKSVTSSSYGGVPFYLYPVVSVSSQALAGDLYRMFGQTTSVYSSYDMHGSALWANGSQISPWATQDHVWNTAYNPNWTDGIYTSSLASSIQFTATMHTSIGTWNPVGAGHILGTQFRQASNSNFSQLQFLKSSTQTAIAATYKIQANAGNHNVNGKSVTLKAGETLRIRNQTQFSYPGRSSNPVYCQTQVYVYSGATLHSTSTLAQKYMNNQMGGIPLYNDELFTAPSDGTYAVYNYAACSAQRSIIVNVSNSSLLIEHFGK